MSFNSQYQSLIWNKLYTVYIPDQLTLPPQYVKRFGTHVTGDKEIDKMVSNNLTLVMIPVIKILEYYEDGIEIQIPSREDMIQMHKDIELYLQEWREHLRVDINIDVHSNKDLLLSLEKLSRNLYNKAKPRELIDNLLTTKRIGLMNPLQMHVENTKEIVKREYEGISSLVKSKTKPQGRF